MSGRTSHRKYHFILSKFLKISKKLFSKSFFDRGLRRSPNIQCLRKKRGGIRVFYFFVNSWNCVRGPCFKVLFEKSPLKIRKNFCTEYTTLFWRKLLGFQSTFHEKYFVSGFGADAPTDNAHEKTRRNPRFLLFFLFAYYNSAYYNGRCRYNAYR